jgi:hypothetical protein
MERLRNIKRKADPSDWSESGSIWRKHSKRARIKARRQNEIKYIQESLRDAVVETIVIDDYLDDYDDCLDGFFEPMLVAEESYHMPKLSKYEYYTLSEILIGLDTLKDAYLKTVLSVALDLHKSKNLPIPICVEIATLECE